MTLTTGWLLRRLLTCWAQERTFRLWNPIILQPVRSRLKFPCPGTAFRLTLTPPFIMLLRLLSALLLSLFKLYDIPSYYNVITNAVNFSRASGDSHSSPIWATSANFNVFPRSPRIWQFLPNSHHQSSEIHHAMHWCTLRKFKLKCSLTECSMTSFRYC